MTIKQIITNVDVRLAVGFVFLFLGAIFPAYAIVCNTIASYLGATLVVTAGKSFIASKSIGK